MLSVRTLPDDVPEGMHRMSTMTSSIHMLMLSIEERVIECRQNAEPLGDITIVSGLVHAQDGAQQTQVDADGSN